MKKNVNDLIELAIGTFGDQDITNDTVIELLDSYDSMNFVQFMIDIETEFGVELADDEIKKSMKIIEIWSAIQAKVV